MVRHLQEDQRAHILSMRLAAGARNFLMKLDEPFFTILSCSIDVSKTKCNYKAVQLLQTLSSACPKLFKQWLAYAAVLDFWKGCIL